MSPHHPPQAPAQAGAQVHPSAHWGQGTLTWDGGIWVRGQHSGHPIPMAVGHIPPPTEVLTPSSKPAPPSPLTSGRGGWAVVSVLALWGHRPWHGAAGSPHTLQTLGTTGSWSQALWGAGRSLSRPSSSVGGSRDMSGCAVGGWHPTPPSMSRTYLALPGAGGEALGGWLYAGGVVALVTCLAHQHCRVPAGLPVGRRGK